MKNLISLIILLTSCVGADENIQKNAYKELSSNKAIILDVRELGELKNSGIVKGAKWIATSKIKENHSDWVIFLKTLSTKVPVYTYCAGGFRASRVTSSLKEKGFKATNLGGFNDLKEAGIPTTRFGNSKNLK